MNAPASPAPGGEAQREQGTKGGPAGGGWERKPALGATASSSPKGSGIAPRPPVTPVNADASRTYTRPPKGGRPTPTDRSQAEPNRERPNQNNGLASNTPRNPPSQLSGAKLHRGSAEHSLKGSKQGRNHPHHHSRKGATSPDIPLPVLLGERKSRRRYGLKTKQNKTKQRRLRRAAFTSRARTRTARGRAGRV